MTQTATPPSFLDHFADTARRLASDGPEWLRDLRRGGMQRFEAQGFPGPREEEWRTTNVKPIVDGGFRPAPERTAPDLADLPEFARLDLGGPRLVFLDGRLVPALSTDPGEHHGAWIGSLQAAIGSNAGRLGAALRSIAPVDGTVFRGLNEALSEDGAVIDVPEGVSVDTPIELVFLSTGDSPTASFPRTLLSVARGANLQVVETYVGLTEGAYLTNSVTEAFVGDGARLETIRIQHESAQAFHVSHNFSRQLRDSNYVHHNVNLGGKLARHELTSVLDGEGSNCQLHGLYLTGDEQHVDHQTVLDHAKPHGDSREVYKGILYGKSRATFRGRIIVREDAQKTDAKQSNPNLLLSDQALAHTRPQLEIYADDVKCTHGATVGRLDQDAIFYLQSRGVPRREARNLLIRAFAREVLEEIPLDSVRERLEEAVGRRLDSVE
jgi:Fe-S cluster assembly protein SufD